MTGGGRTVLRGGLVFDGGAGEPQVRDVFIDGEHVVAASGVTERDRVIDVSGLNVVPAFTDCHVHVNRYIVDLASRLEHPFSVQFIAAANHLAQALDSGITTLRDAGGADLGTKTAQAEGMITGARLLISIAAIGQTGGHTDAWKVSGAEAYHWMPHPGRPLALGDGPDELRKVARQLFRAGADLLKVCTTGGVMSTRDDPRHAQFTGEELEVLVEEAEMHGTYVMAHAQGAVGIRNAVLAGVRSIEHGTFLDQETADLMIERGVWLVPTLTATQSIVDAVDAGLILPEATVKKAKAGLSVQRDAVAMAYERGVRIAMGTDAGVSPHGRNLRELELMAAAGMKPLDVLRATTSSAADLLGTADRYGRIEVGKRADIVVYGGELTEFSGLQERIRYVFQDGEQVRTFDDR